jgi:hypothetical protein
MRQLISRLIAYFIACLPGGAGSYATAGTGIPR